jgi:hypothetical protein
MSARLSRDTGYSSWASTPSQSGSNTSLAATEEMSTASGRLVRFTYTNPPPGMLLEYCIVSVIIRIGNRILLFEVHESITGQKGLWSPSGTQYPHHVHGNRAAQHTLIVDAGIVCDVSQLRFLGTRRPRIDDAHWTNHEFWGVTVDDNVAQITASEHAVQYRLFSGDDLPPMQYYYATNIILEYLQRK